MSMGPKPISLLERFERHYIPEPNSGCWLWIGATNELGYGILKQTQGRRRNLKAHAVAFMLFKGPIANGLEPDHLCRNSFCVNPDHLELVTHRENCLRGTSPAALNAKKTHCIRGHEFTPENTWIEHRKNEPMPRRHCRACRRERKRDA